MITVKIDIPDMQAILLSAKAAEQGLTLEKWFQKLAEKELPFEAPIAGDRPSVVEEMRALRSRLKPDPEGWSLKDYVTHGRR
jgi:hypothetical protein